MFLPSKRIRPDRALSSPITLLSSVLLPTPLRPIKQTTSPGPTAKSTSRTISVSPYATESFSIASIGVSILSEVHLDYFGVFLNRFYSTFAEDLALVKDRYGLRDLADESHIVLDDQEGV